MSKVRPPPRPARAAVLLLVLAGGVLSGCAAEPGDAPPAVAERGGAPDRAAEESGARTADGEARPGRMPDVPEAASAERAHRGGQQAARDEATVAAPAPDAEGAPRATDAQVAEAPARQGPWHVLCLREDDVVFEHEAIYRVWHPEDRPPQWAYETDDGIRFRGRIGARTNCTWERRDVAGIAPLPTGGDDSLPDPAMDIVAEPVPEPLAAPASVVPSADIALPDLRGPEAPDAPAAGGDTAATGPATEEAGGDQAMGRGRALEEAVPAAAREPAEDAPAEGTPVETDGTPVEDASAEDEAGADEPEAIAPGAPRRAAAEDDVLLPLPSAADFGGSGALEYAPGHVFDLDRPAEREPE